MLSGIFHIITPLCQLELPESFSAKRILLLKRFSLGGGGGDVELVTISVAWSIVGLNVLVIVQL